MNNPSKAALLLLGALLPAAPQARSQIITQASVVGTGAVQSANATYRIAGSLGQAAVGRVNADPTTIAEGFWYALPSAKTSALTERPAAGAQMLTLHSSPNPFAETTQLTLRIPRAGHASLILYDLLGQPVRTLLDEEQPEGTLTLTLFADELSSGRYTAVLNAGGEQRTISLTLMK